MNKTITVAYGDGIGPEIMKSVLFILKEAGAQIDCEVIEIGEKLYLNGVTTGIETEAWNSLRRTKVFLKAPITTPQGGGYKSLNVTIREALGLYANIRPCVAYHPFVATKHPGMNVVIIRENEEDVYAGLEYQHTSEVFECLKLITRPGCERIVRYAFEYAKAHKRRKVTCMTKDNIMKLTDGLFHKVFNEIGLEYPQIEQEHWIIDIGAAKLADNPCNFDVVVLPNLYGDILSDIAAQLAGSVGLAGSANIGMAAAMFEAIHGSAPRHAGKNTANPSGLLMGAILMLLHIGQNDVAERVHNAWLKTIEEGIHTKDICAEKSVQQVGTQEFAQAIVKALGQKPLHLSAVTYENSPIESLNCDIRAPRDTAVTKGTLRGIDIFLEFEGTVEELATKLKAACKNIGLQLEFISNRGINVWPHGLSETFCVNHWRARFVGTPSDIKFEEMLSLQKLIYEQGFATIKTEVLRSFN